VIAFNLAFSLANSAVSHKSSSCSVFAPVLGGLIHVPICGIHDKGLLLVHEQSHQQAWICFPSDAISAAFFSVASAVISLPAGTDGVVSAGLSAAALFSERAAAGLTPSSTTESVVGTSFSLCTGFFGPETFTNFDAPAGVV